MSRALKFASAAFAAAVVETGLLWVLSRVGALDLAIDLAVAYAGGYLTLVAALHVLRSSAATSPFGAELRTYALLGIASVLIAVAIVYLGVYVVGVSLAMANAAGLVAVAFWITPGWPFVRGGHRSPS